MFLTETDATSLQHRALSPLPACRRVAVGDRAFQHLLSRLHCVLPSLCSPAVPCACPAPLQQVSPGKSTHASPGRLGLGGGREGWMEQMHIIRDVASQCMSFCSQHNPTTFHPPLLAAADAAPSGGLTGIWTVRLPLPVSWWQRVVAFLMYTPGNQSSNPRCRQCNSATYPISTLRHSTAW